MKMITKQTLIQLPLTTLDQAIELITFELLLRQFHREHLDINIDREQGRITMTDEQCLIFCLKYPEYSDKFTEVNQ